MLELLDGRAPGRLYTFALDAKGVVPPMTPVTPPPDPSGALTAESIPREFERVGLPDGRRMTAAAQLLDERAVVTRFRLAESGWHTG